MIVAATGHRPNKLGGWSREVHDALCGFALRALADRQPQGVISGMALGWDHAVAVASVRLGIPFVAAIPFEGQESRWSKQAQGDYHKLLLAAEMTHVVCSRERVQDIGVAAAMQARNEWMVDNATGVLALWNGDRSGGTFNCVQYAVAGRRRIENVWLDWEDWWDGGKYLV